MPCCRIIIIIIIVISGVALRRREIHSHFHSIDTWYLCVVPSCLVKFWYCARGYDVWSSLYKALRIYTLFVRTRDFACTAAPHGLFTCRRITVSIILIPGDRYRVIVVIINKMISMTKLSMTLSRYEEEFVIVNHFIITII